MRAPRKPTFSQQGLQGFRFLLENKELEVYKVSVTKGHDNFIISKTCTHIYYMLEGEGTFSIGKKEVRMRVGELIEIPPNVEYCYTGAMELLLIMQPPWFEGNATIVKKNPAVGRKTCTPCKRIKAA